MSQNQPDQNAPTNAELAERTARIEQKVENVEGTVDRIEGRLINEHEELEKQVQDNKAKIRPVHTAYRFSRWIAPLMVGGGGVLGVLASLGVL